VWIARRFPKPHAYVIMAVATVAPTISVLKAATADSSASDPLTLPLLIAAICFAGALLVWLAARSETRLTLEGQHLVLTSSSGQRRIHWLRAASLHAYRRHKAGYGVRAGAVIFVELTDGSEESLHVNPTLPDGLYTGATRLFPRLFLDNDAASSFLEHMVPYIARSA